MLYSSGEITVAYAVALEISPTPTITPTASCTPTPIPTETATCLPVSTPPVYSTAPVPTFTVTPIETVTAISTGIPAPLQTTTPSVTPTPTPSAVNGFGVTNPGGPYVSLPCLARVTTVQLSGSFNASLAAGDSVLWTTSCPGASFNDSTILSPILTFSSLGADNLPTVCQVTVAVTKGGITTNSTADVAVGMCPKDCTGAYFGSANSDACGVCGGTGSSCVNCTSVSVAGAQRSLDVNAASLRTNVLRLASRLSLAAKTPSEKNRFAKQAAKARLLANDYYKFAWQSIYTEIPSMILSCPAEKLCAQSSNVTTKGEYQGNIDALSKLITSLSRTVAKNSSLKSQVKSIQKAASKDIVEIKKALATVPNSTSICT